MKNLSPLLRIVFLGGAWASASDGALAKFGAPTGMAPTLERGFSHPPDSARPWVYWFWENGNVTKEGVTADLEAMERVGVGGALIMNVPHIPAGPVKFFSPDWREMFKHAVSVANRLGLEVAMTAGDGATGSGGPWIRPQEAMQELVWSETRVEGPAKVALAPPQPPTNLDYYRDVAVLAFPTPPKEMIRMADRHPKVTASFKNFDGAKVIDGDTKTRANLQGDKSAGAPYVQLEFAEPFPARALALTITGVNEAQLQVSNDGAIFQAVCQLDLARKNRRSTTFNFKEVSGRFYRLVLPEAVKPNLRIMLWEIELLAAPRVSKWELKAVFTGDGRSFVPPASPPKTDDAPSIRREQIVNVTTKMGSDGRLNWEAAQGRWTILRIGFTPTGMEPHSATAEGKGLECDKLSKKGIEAQFSNFVEKLLGDVGPLTGKTLRYTHIDSWEVGSQNWTAEFPDEFRKRRGYDLTPWLPVMAGGRIVDSPGASERFLWDVRRTLGELLVENYFDRIRELSHARGMEFEAEATGPGVRTCADQLQCKGRTDIPMGEFWISPAPAREISRDCKEAASAAHIYGRPIAAAESFTAWPGRSRWQNDPYALKPYGDRAFCTGINRLVIHNYVSQPWANRAPGLTLGPFGTEFCRTVTWWEQSTAWLSYLSRCQFLLQQGRFVGDVCWFIGENAPIGLATKKELQPEIPTGYDYDGCSAETIFRMTVRDSRLTLPNGMNYSALVMPDSATMTPALARKIKELVHAGALVVGPKPVASPSLEDYPRCDAEIQSLAGEVWGDCDGKASTEHVFGKGKVVWGKSLKTVFEEANTPPDFEFNPDKKSGGEGGDEGIQLEYIHRRDGNADIYFVSNQAEQSGETLCVFRVSGKAAELWRPDSGAIVKSIPQSQTQGRTRVPIHFDPYGSVFVVFREPAAAAPIVAPPKGELPAPLTISGAWELRFPAGWGAPEKITLANLISWTEHDNPGVKYFSGTATYVKDIEIPAAMFSDGKMLALDLGQVKNLAEVKLNGKDLGVLWKPPFRVDIAGAAKPGANHLEIRITNLWSNRLIGDEQLPDDCEWTPHAAGGFALKEWPKWLLEGKPSPTGRLTFTTWKHYTKDSPLLASGLLGPVRLIPARSPASEF